MPLLIDGHNVIGRMPDLSLAEFYLAQDILYSLFYYSEKDLTRMIYNSKPIRNLGAIEPGTASGKTIKFSFSK